MAVLLDRAERASYVDVDVPTSSRLPVVGGMKKVLRKLMAWYMRYVAQQVTAVSGTLTQAVRLVDGRVRRLEDGTTGAGPLRAELDRTPPASLEPSAVDAVVDALTGVEGRVLVATCGRAELVRTLRAEGVAAYGVEPRRALLAEALRQGLDVRPDDPLDHLAALPERSLAGVVLADVVEWLPPAALVRLVHDAARALVPGGRLLVLSATPEAWARHRSPVQTDLAPGRPWHADTWLEVLGHRGFSDVQAEPHGAEAPLVRLDGDDAVAKAVNANADALAPLLGDRAAYLVRARRAG